LPNFSFVARAIVSAPSIVTSLLSCGDRSGAPIECFAEREQVPRAEEHSLRAALGAHAELLDMAIGDSTAREIRESRGHVGKTAERRGIFLINEAFAALRTLVGENSLPKAA
jgi:hypothetical protein